MSAEVYYFSGTGNSLHVARELQARLPAAQLIPILGVDGTGPVRTSGEMAGFVFPHYASSLPRAVEAFIERLDPTATRYLFAIATRGGTKTMAFAQIDDVLGRKGRRLDSFFAITMPGGNEALVKGYAERITAERIGQLETAMLARLDEIGRIITNGETSREEDRGDVALPTFLEPLIPVLDAVSPHLVRLGKKVESSFEFYCDETCTGCGVCARVCLADRVEMVDGRPAWLGSIRCHGCFACLSFCPHASIQVKSKWYLKSYTEQNGRYHHPEITAGDIAAQRPEGTAAPRAAVGTGAR